MEYRKITTGRLDFRQRIKAVVILALIWRRGIVARA